MVKVFDMLLKNRDVKTAIKQCAKMIKVVRKHITQKHSKAVLYYKPK